MDIESIRTSLKIKDSQTILLAFAWITGKELSMLSRFPEFLCGDVTERTNIEKRGLFIVTGQDGNNKSFVAFHCYMPNSKMDTYDWIYSNAIPELASNYIIQRNEVFITDGENALFSPLLNAIKIPNGPWKNCYHYRCTYHLFYQAWKKRLSGKIHTKEGSKVVETIRVWIHSLITEVRLYSDYDDSVKKLRNFIADKKTCLSDYVYEQIYELFFDTMNPTSTSWAKFARDKRLDLGHSTTSLCERTNRTLKETMGKKSKLAVLQLAEAANVAWQQSETANKEIERYVFF